MRSWNSLNIFSVKLHQYRQQYCANTEESNFLQSIKKNTDTLKIPSSDSEKESMKEKQMYWLRLAEMSSFSYCGNTKKKRYFYNSTKKYWRVEKDFITRFRKRKKKELIVFWKSMSHTNNTKIYFSRMLPCLHPCGYNFQFRVTLISKMNSATSETKSVFDMHIKFLKYLILPPRVTIFDWESRWHQKWFQRP